MNDSPKPLPLQEVKSSNVQAVGYDAETQRFGVRFKNGATYHYEGVDAKTAEAVSTAPSVGSAVHSVLVKGSFKYTRLPENQEK